MKKLQTDEIRLEPYDIQHLGFFKKWRDYYSEYFFGQFPESFDALEQGYNKYLKDHMKGAKVWFVIYELSLSPMQKDNSVPIGMIGLNDIDYKNGACELGQMFLNQDKRGSGYMNQAIELLMDLCFKELRMNVVYLWTTALNQGAIECYRKSGFELSGGIPDALYRNGEHWKKILMTLREVDWDDKKYQTEEKAKAA